MRLPKMTLGFKLFLSFFLVATVPVSIFNIFWFTSSERKLDDLQLEFLFFFLILVGIVLFALLVSLFASRRLIRPIKQLEAGAKLLGKGDLQYRFKALTGDEIEDLANEFNAMADALEQKIEEIKDESAVIAGERNKLEIVISGITDAVIAADLDSKITIFNAAAQRLTGFTKEEAMGKPLEEIVKLFDVDNEIAPATYCPIRTDVAEGIVYKKKQLRLVGKHTESFVDVVTGRIKEASEANVGCILALHDKTEEQRIEKMKLDFVSMAAHELRTPLTSLRGYLSVFMQENKGKLSDDQGMFLTRANIAASQLAALVEDLLSVSRIEQGVFVVNLQEVDWVKNVEQVIDELQERAKERGVILTFTDPAQKTILVHVDKIRINEVLLNLIANAITFTPKGGQVQIQVEKTDHEVITHITDTGGGIPKEAIPQLFTKFFRVSGLLQTGSKGTGLGLYIAKSIVDMHKGRIWADSTMGEGTIFSFSLPTK